MSHHEAAFHHQRAADLRHLARRIRDTPSMSLHLHAGVDTWYGPRAEECLADLARARERAHAAADELDARAWRLEHHADELTMRALRAERLDTPGHA